MTLRFYVKSNFARFKRSKNGILGNFRHSELRILLHLGLESCSNLLKSRFTTSKIAKNDVFELFEFTKIWFHMKSSFGEFKRSRNVIFGNFRGSEFWFYLANLNNFQVPNLPKIKVQSLQTAKNDVFGLFESAKMWFHVIWVTAKWSYFNKVKP